MGHSRELMGFNMNPKPSSTMLFQSLPKDLNKQVLEQTKINTVDANLKFTLILLLLSSSILSEATFT